MTETDLGEKAILRAMLRIAHRETAAGTPRAEAVLAWAGEHAGFLELPGVDTGGPAGGPAKKGRKAKKARRQGTAAWAALGAALATGAPPPAEEPPAPLRVAGRLAALLALTPVDARLLALAVACNRVRRVAGLAYRLRGSGLDPALLAAELAGLETVDTLPASAPVRLGLVSLRASHSGEATLELTRALARALERAPEGEEALVESLVGAEARGKLELADFADRGAAIGLVRRILEGALATGAPGVNILFHGPPGTGKTELAKALAGAVGARLHAVGEADEYGDEPNRWDRVTALRLAQRVLARRRDALLLFDEMEDLIGEVQRAQGGGYFSRRDGSKVFLNRLFETNPVPTLWTSNAIENVDPAYLRRMSFVLKMDLPPATVRRRIIGRIAAAEGMALPEAAAGRLAEAAPEAVTVAQSAIRAACLAGGDAAAVAEVTEALVAGVRHGRRVAGGLVGATGPLDLGLYHAAVPVEDLVGRLARPGAPLDFSLLMTGPPGTGKTALAQHIARALDRPLEIKRASDLLSKWVGESEKLIAEAFAEAAEHGHVLLFDEIDSLLFDRASASRSWEVSQVNELLTWMDRHPMPFIAATNHAGRLDPAAMRRFVFKLALEPLPPDKAARAWRRFFGARPPAALRDAGGLTPGDFAVVRRQLGFLPEPPGPAELLRLVLAEATARPVPPGPLGFRAD